MTQAGLAEAAGVPLGTIRDYEQDKRDPLASNLVKLAKALRVSLDELFARADFITLHTPLTEATRNMIHAGALASSADAESSPWLRGR